MKSLLRIILERWLLTPAELARLRFGRVLTADQETLIEADRKTVLRAMLSPEQWQIVESLEQPDKFLPDVTFTETEAAALEQMFLSPLWAKLDVAMINWTQQRAQEAIAADVTQIVAAAKFAHGCRAGFAMTKTISRLTAAKSSQPEEETPTAAADLEHHTP